MFWQFEYYYVHNIQFQIRRRVFEQNRIKDETWTNILSRLRVGECNESDLDEIRKLVLTNPDCDIPDFSKAPWDQAILVTPRHSIRNLWNEHAIAKHCIKTGIQRYIVPAEDNSRDGTETLSMEAKLTIAGQADNRNGNYLTLSRWQSV